jgi:hypothetical protein
MINPKDYYITKSSGDKQKFDESKLNTYLLNVGVEKDLANNAVTEIEKNLDHINSTDDIYHNVSDFFKHQGSLDNYFNFSLKRAVMMLGPSGHPFENLVADVLFAKGYRTEVGVIALGKCVTHEIDVVAKKDNIQYFIECKFHNTPGTKTDIQVALYTYARFLDVKESMHQHNKDEEVTYLPWLITNTKVTNEVFNYGNCNNLKVTAWYLPTGESLRDMIISSHTHPITLLFHISPRKINVLIESGIVTVNSLKEAIHKDKVNHILTHDEIHHVLEDIKYLYK